MKRLCILLLLLFQLPLLFTQTQSSTEVFNWLENEGEIPGELQKMVIHPEKTAQWSLRDLFLQGELIYGTEVNRYLDRILDRILAEDPALRAKIRCFAVRSPEVNAYALPNGILLINIGLIAQASNESEIAFVLGHETAHYAEKHHQQKKQREIPKGKKEKNEKGRIIIEDFLKEHSYSREIEMEADRIAIERYYKGYSYEALRGLFDLLQYDNLPFDEIPFPRALVEEEFYEFPDSYFLENISPIRNRDDYIDTLSTHPNIKKRRENMEQLTRGLDNTGRVLFAQPEIEFERIRDLCRFECVNMFLINHNYDHALYNIHLLRDKKQDDQFLDVAMAMAYYGLSAHKLRGEYARVMPNYRGVEGEKQQLNHVFTKMSRQELNVLALRNIWEMRMKYPDNPFLDNLLAAVARDLLADGRLKASDFSDYSQHIDPKEIPEEKQSDSLEDVGSRYQRIRKRAAMKVVPTEKFKTLNYMLVDLKADSAFMDYMEKMKNRIEDEKTLERLKPANHVKTHPPVDSLTVLRPYYWQTMNARGTVTDAKREEHLQRVLAKSEKIDKTVLYALEKLKFHYRFYQEEDLAGFNTEDYNNYTQTQLWQWEYLAAGETKMSLYQCRNSDQIMKMTGNHDVLFLYVYSMPARFVSVDKIMKTVFFAPFQYTMVPMSLLNFLLPRYKTYVTISAVDLRNGKTIRAENAIHIGDMTSSYVNALIYDMFYKVRKGY